MKSEAKKRRRSNNSSSSTEAVAFVLWFGFIWYHKQNIKSSQWMNERTNERMNERLVQSTSFEWNKLLKTWKFCFMDKHGSIDVYMYIHFHHPPAPRKQLLFTWKPKWLRENIHKYYYIYISMLWKFLELAKCVGSVLLPVSRLRSLFDSHVYNVKGYRARTHPYTHNFWLKFYHVILFHVLSMRPCELGNFFFHLIFFCRVFVLLIYCTFLMWNTNLKKKKESIRVAGGGGGRRPICKLKQVRIV